MEKQQIIILRADQGKWLYKDETVGDIETRTFVSQVMNADDDWHECTDAEKEAWEAAHRPVPPEDPANDRVEDIEPADAH